MAVPVKNKFDKDIKQTTMDDGGSANGAPVVAPMRPNKSNPGFTEVGAEGPAGAGVQTAINPVPGAVVSGNPQTVKQAQSVPIYAPPMGGDNGGDNGGGNGGDNGGGNGGGDVQPPVTLPDGVDGNGQPPVNLPSSDTTPATPATPVAPSVPTTLPSANGLTARLKGTMSDWRDTVNKQQQAKIDYAVQQAVAELQRAEQDAQGQFKEQAESVALDERQGMDNAALYAEARGDKGGIGLAQYNEIQAAAAQNRLSVQQAQTKLSTDTARQIADLRAKGEFDKADALLEVSQTYLTQLMQLEQWAANYGLDVEKFRQSLDQWQHEYDLALEKFGYQKTQDSKQSATELGMALLNAGIPVDDATLKAMNMTREQANAWMLAAQMGVTGGPDGSPAGGYKTNAELFAAVKAAGGTDEDSALAALRILGVEYPGDFINAYMAWLGSQPGESGKKPLSSEDGSKIYVPGYGMVTWTKAQELVQNGTVYVMAHDENGDPVFARTPGSTAQTGGLIPPTGGFTGGK